MDDALGKKTNTRSVIWNYFGLNLDGDGKPINEDKPVCQKCKVSISVKRSNTSNMFHHLQDHHPCLYKEASMHQELGNKTIESTSGIDTSTQLTITDRYPSQSPQAQELNQACQFINQLGMYRQDGGLQLII